MPDSWEESFDTWSGEDVRRLAGALPEDLGVEREALLRLARDLAERRAADRT